MQTLSEIKSILAARGIRPKHRLGQNFLHDHNLIRKLIESAVIAPGDLILEIGPGTGALTEALIETGVEIIACEVDRALAAIIREGLGDRITLIEGDALAGKHAINPAILEALAGRPFKLVANLPYGIASPVIANLLVDHAEQCRGMFVTIQKEVADRLLAAPGRKEYGPLSIIIQAFAQIERIAKVPRECFWPRPDVTSAMVSVRPVSGAMGKRSEAEFARAEPGDVRTGKLSLAHGTPESPESRRAFARFVTNLFTKRRKQLGTIFGRDVKFPAHIDAKLRPEALSINQIIALYEEVHVTGSGVRENGRRGRASRPGG